MDAEKYIAILSWDNGRFILIKKLKPKNER